MKSTKHISISPEAYHQFEAYEWPGNVRQLQNYVESMVIMTDEDGTVRSVPLALYKVKAVRMSAKRV